MSPDRPTLRARLRRLDPAARAAVVADCWAAAGHDVERDGATVRVAGAGSERRLSTVDDPAADRVLDAGAVTEVLLYRVDRADADRIAERHLGAPLGDLRPPRSVRIRRRAADAATPAALVALLLLVAGVAVGATGGGAFDSEDAGDAGAAAETATPYAPPPVEASQVPGLGSSGVVDLRALAAAHERARPDAYVVEASSTRTASDYDVVRRNVTLEVEDDRYRAVVTVTDDGGTRRATVYSDGSDRWQTTSRDGVLTVERLGANETGPTSVDPAAVGGPGVRDWLAVPETDVDGPVERDGRTAYRVVGTGTPANSTAAVESYRVVAYVRPDGFVFDLAVEYTLIGPRQSDRRFEWTYVRDDASVRSPEAGTDAGDD